MRYQGSKLRLAKHILPIMLFNRKPGQWYVEPFCGGCNTIDKVSNPRIAADCNEYLVALFQAIVGGWIPEKISREQYSSIINNKGAYPKHIVGWAGFGCSYCGKFFGGYAGLSTTKLGTKRDYQQEAINSLLRQAKDLDGATLTCCDYVALDIPPKSIIYCDPPYKGTSGYKGNKPFDHQTFWEWVHTKHREGHTVFVSEYEAPESCICLWHTTVKSSLSANGLSGGSKKSTEKLFLVVG